MLLNEAEDALWNAASALRSDVRRLSAGASGPWKLAAGVEGEKYLQDVGEVIAQCSVALDELRGVQQFYYGGMGQ